MTVPGGGAAARARTRIDADVAARVISPLWPLHTFIAVNPLDGLVELGFDEAAAQAQRWLRARCFPDAGWLRTAHHAGRITDADLRASVLARHPDLGDDEVAAFLSELLEHPAGGPTPAPAPRTAAERCDELLGTDLVATVDAMVATLCAAFVDEGPAAWPMPGRSGGLYRAWRRLAPHDPGLRRLVGRRACAELRRLPEHPEDAIVEALDDLGVAPESYRDELRGQLCRLPGWAGYARWRDEWAPPDDPAPRFSIVDLVAVRLAHEALAVRAATGTPVAAPSTEPQPDRQAVDERAAVWLDAYERHYRDQLLATMARPTPASSVRRPVAQLVCCIDARSEGLRRHLEAIGDYETLGFAGFFGVAIRFRPLGATDVRARCPVLVAPRVEIEERPILGEERLVERQLARWRAAAAAGSALYAAKTGAGGAFTLAEISGWVNGPVAIARTLRPRRRVRAERRARLRTAPTVDANADGLGFTLDEQVLYAETALVIMGLTGGFAPLVLLCGHGGRTTNNPHASALDCGACGGNPGGPNARVAAAILNRSEVRGSLRERGIDIPPSTWFLAGEHDTTTDTVVIFDRHAVPPGLAGAVAALEGDLAIAGRRLAAERVRALPGGRVRRPAAHAAARAQDWAEVRPEWGLARNTAFIVGPRSITVGLDLGCRTFLHSYDTAIDPDGTALETILTAPMVVAQWINAQYYFSTVDPDVFGAGDKTLHNPVGGVGVLLGGGGDLRAGLPRQSVLDGDDPYHEPMRLLTVVQAPLERITAVVDRNDVLRHLFDGGWVTLAARAHPAAPWQLRRGDGTWAPWQPAVRADDHMEVTV